MADFFQMGGYALYVWSSYVLAFVVILALLVAPVRCERQLIARIARQLRRRNDASGTP